MKDSAAPANVFRLVPPFVPAVAVELRGAAVAAIQSGAPRYTVDLDALPYLDSPVIAALIATLREVRELGGELVLGVTRPKLLDTLRVTALDKVFRIEAPPAEFIPPETGAPPNQTIRRSRLVTATVVCLGLVVGLALRGAAQGTVAPDAIVAHVVAANPSLQSYQARVHVAVHMQSFPFLAPRLEGSSYFKRPDNYEVVFDRIPSYAKGFDRLYADIGDPTSWPRRFNMTVIGERTVDGHTDTVLRLVQKVRGMIDHEDVAIDEGAWRIDQMEWHYYNGGAITMTQQFAHAGSWSVPVAQHAVIHIPYVHAVADARYDDYRTNVAIDDAVFVKNRGK
ncbi:MAG: STAS domain-containing protein [Candidatus Eremiobacteraeota bacterium]|nr:STAS domain-containing protein [Candidatus Eremiobacteraeota bacterium]MBV9648245.1 STAS domain-containing protein [Candidatus Eremiobacteraeota bacterium]